LGTLRPSMINNGWIYHFVLSYYFYPVDLHSSNCLLKQIQIVLN
jgi:hypothetical protein